MKQLLFTILFFLITGVSFSQTVVKGVVYITEEKKYCDLYSKVKTKITPGVIVSEKSTSNATITLRNGEFSLILAKKSFPDTIIFSYMGYKNKEIIINHPKDTSVSVTLNLSSDIIDFAYYSFTNFSIYSSSNKYTPFGLGVKIYFTNPFFRTNLFTAYNYSTNQSNNKFKELKIGIHNYYYNFSIKYIYQDYNYQDDNYNLIRNKIDLTKSCYDMGIYPTLSYSFNKDNILNNSFSAYKFSLTKRVINKSYFSFFLSAGTEYYSNFSYQAEANLNFDTGKLHRMNILLGINYDTFMDFDLLNISLQFNFRDIPYWPFRFGQY
ncbi:MAG: carboxypeptidase-like regulatory domain-containing protein [Chlorobi bacterium]|nr:carboxypeptidase-like regulatory domain-containing protein [Chlorobiota bacterium]